MAASPESSGVLLIRAWVEGQRLKARIIGRTDATSSGESGQVVAGADQIVKVVRDWLKELISAAEPGT
jgi:hypothetical protein